MAKSETTASPPADEVIADTIKEISESVKKLRAGRLNDKALLLLITHGCPTAGQRQVKEVLDAMENLSTAFLKKEPTTKLTWKVRA